MKLRCLFFVIFAVMIPASWSDASAQDLTAVTRPRRVTEPNQRISPEPIEAKLAIADKTAEPDGDLKPAGPWVYLSKTISVQQSGGQPQDTQPSQSGGGQAQSAQELKDPVLDQVNVGDSQISGTSESGVTIQLVRNGIEDPKAKTTVRSDNRFTLRFSPAIKSSDVIILRLTNGGQTLDANVAVVKMMNLTHPNLVGLAPFGIVTSQQADRFSQADPFGGFIIGYMSTARRTVACIPRANAKPGEPFEECLSIPYARLDSRFGGCFDSDGRFNPNSRGCAIRYPYKPNLNIRIQGIFESDGRKAAAPPATSTNTGGNNGGSNGGNNGGGTTGGGTESGTPAAGEPVTFIASRKTFDVDLHLWQEYRFLRSPVFHWGPYAAIGGSFTMSKNELVGEGVTADTGGGGNSVPLDTSKVSTSNGGKLYYEGGLALNFYNSDPNDSNLYVQAFLALGHYEAFADLRPKANTKWRGVGKLRVFPFGLNRDFFEHGVASPLFGIDLNAGKGPDQVKFFIGTVLNITKFIDKLKGEAPTAAAP